jgi:hypothetical protein
MSLLREILAESFLLMEDVTNQGNDIKSAVENMHPAHIVYNGPSDGGNGERVIYPVAYGVSTAGNLVVRAFQPQGSTSSEVPAWKFFRLDRISEWDTDNSETFNPAELKGFNDNGDEQIDTLYAYSPIGHEKPQQTQPGEPARQNKPEEPEKVITSHPVSKHEVDNGGADNGTESERYNYTGNDAIQDILRTSNPKISQPMDKEIQQNIDKLPGNPDNTHEAIPVRDSVPVTKSEVGGNNEPDINAQRNNTEIPVNDGPITDDDVESQDIDRKNGDMLAESFRDLLRRMNGLYKD